MRKEENCMIQSNPKRNTYHEKVGKFIEKQSDRDTLKGKSFTKCFEKCFLEASERFRLCLLDEARSTLRPEVAENISLGSQVSDLCF